MIELKPCPICGKEPKLHNVYNENNGGTSWNFIYVECPNCGHRCHGYRTHKGALYDDTDDCLKLAAHDWNHNIYYIEARKVSAANEAEITTDNSDLVISKTDIVNMISVYVKLEKRSDFYFGACPFCKHGPESSKLLLVNPEKQMYYCAGCGDGGNVITFVMHAAHLNYKDALTFLTERLDYNAEQN
jgi:transcription elongation factor Elf1